jgi:hypothetical protein
MLPGFLFKSILCFIKVIGLDLISNGAVRIYKVIMPFKTSWISATTPFAG